LLHRFTLLYLSLTGFLVGFKGALFLDHIDGHTHVYEKDLASTTVPDVET
jgi:hypothetical protein